MNALIVGNGFDLAHGLPTTYWDCLNFLKIAANCLSWSLRIWDEFHKAKTVELEQFPAPLQEFLEHFFSAEKENACKDEPDFACFRDSIKDNFWLKHFLHCANDLPADKKPWIDFEHEIAAVVRQMESMVTAAKSGVWKDGRKALHPFSAQDRNFDDHFLKLYQYCNLEDSLKHLENRDMQAIISPIYGDLERFTDAIEIYLRLCMNLIAPTKPNLLPDIVNIGKIDKVISFNYTDTFRRYAPDAEACFIHGKIRSDFSAERSSIVLGIDEYLDETERDQKTDFLMFKKCYQRIYKATDYNYRQWFRHGDRGGRRCANSAGTDDYFDNNVYIFGHSLDVTDKDALSEILLADYTKTTIFYRSESQLASQVTNLIRIIGIDKLNELARSEPRAIFFQKQQTSKD